MIGETSVTIAATNSGTGIYATPRRRAFPNPPDMAEIQQWLFQQSEELVMATSGGTRNMITQSQRDAARATEPEC